MRHAAARKPHQPARGEWGAAGAGAGAARRAAPRRAPQAVACAFRARATRIKTHLAPWRGCDSWAPAERATLATGATLRDCLSTVCLPARSMIQLEGVPLARHGSGCGQHLGVNPHMHALSPLTAPQVRARLGGGAAAGAAGSASHKSQTRRSVRGEWQSLAPCLPRTAHTGSARLRGCRCVAAAAMSDASDAFESDFEEVRAARRGQPQARLVGGAAGVACFAVGLASARWQAWQLAGSWSRADGPGGGSQCQSNPSGRSHGPKVGPRPFHDVRDQVQLRFQLASA